MAFHHHIRHQVRKLHKKVRQKYEEWGFTLVELLVVIGVIGALAGGLIAVINPGDKIAQARDAVIARHIAQIGRAMNSYSISSSTFPDPEDIESVFINTGLLTSIPSNPNPESFPCNSSNGVGATLVNGYCINVSSPSDVPYGAVVYAPLTSTSGTVGCNPPATAWQVWSAVVRGAGLHCSTNEPNANIAAYNPTGGGGPVPSPSTTPLATIPPPLPTNTPTPTSGPGPTSVPTNVPTLTPTPGETSVLSVNIAPGCSQVSLDWNAVTNISGTSVQYYLQKCADVPGSCGGSGYSAIFNAQNLLSYVDNTVTNDQPYTYRVRARFPDTTFTPYTIVSTTPTCP